MSKVKTALDEYQPDFRLIDERGATVERKARAGSDTFVDDKQRSYVRDAPIERALSRKVITAAQYTAAQKFYNHWYRAGLAENFGSADLNRVFGGADGFAGMAKTENQAFHRQRYREAVQLIGMKGSQVLEWLICQERTLEEIGGELLGWRNKSQAIAAATEAARGHLDSLCTEWGIGP